MHIPEKTIKDLRDAGIDISDLTPDEVDGLIRSLDGVERQFTPIDGGSMPC